MKKSIIILFFVIMIIYIGCQGSDDIYIDNRLPVELTAIYTFTDNTVYTNIIPANTKKKTYEGIGEEYFPVKRLTLATNDYVFYDKQDTLLKDDHIFYSGDCSALGEYTLIVQ